MLDFFTSSTGFLILLALFATGAIGALALGRRDQAANIWSAIWAVAGSLYGLILAGAVIANGRSWSVNLAHSALPLWSPTIKLDLLSAFFIAVISLIALCCSVYSIGYVRHFYQRYNIGALGFFYHLFIIGMLLVVTAANGIFFIVVWEIMSVASYFLVIYDRDRDKNVQAGFLYLIMTHLGTALIATAWLLLYKYTGSFDFSAIKGGAVMMPSLVKDAVFVLMLIGFGTKAGIIPFHIWLPAAHPAAPSHVSALMSGVMIKTGVFMMIRIFLDLLMPTPLWWGLTILIIGAVSSLLGVLYALTEHDLKKLLAYHSIENIGIILLGVGSAMTFYSLNLPSLAMLGLVAALFHTINHAIFKSLLFLSAGSVINETGTKNMEDYGGLIKLMPETAMLFLIGSMAISALPPFNGFFSEWLTFQTLFAGIAQLRFAGQWAFILSAGALAFTGGLALACFVKAFGVTFLARPRSEAATKARESAATMRTGMWALAGLAVAFGLLSGQITIWLQRIGQSLSGFQNVSSAVTVNVGQSIKVGSGFASVNALILAAVMIVALILVLLVARFLINGKQRVSYGATWDCGTDLTPRMEMTATGFARSIVLIFKSILKPSIQHEIEYHDEDSRFLPKSRAVTMGIGNMYHVYFYEPIHVAVNGLSMKVKNIQSGNINGYTAYIFIALMIALFLVS